MATVRFSPLISSMSGSTANVVFSVWKGRSYVRERVIPANPRSDDQVQQRNYMSKCVGWWHDMKAILKVACDELGATWSVSGFNAFVARDLKDMADGVAARIMPLNSPVNPVDNFEAATGTVDPGDISLSWTQGEAAALADAWVAYEKADVPAGQSAIVIQTTGIAVETGAATLTGLDPGEVYRLWLLVKREKTDLVSEMFSIARDATATSKAAA